MKLAPIPTSKAKTAWGLLQDVKRAILKEPKRANMQCYVDTQLPKDGGPACGTVGCFAGWVTLLSGYKPRGHVRSDADDIARDILGDCNYHTVGRVDPWLGRAGFVFNGGEGDACSHTEPGTAQHATAVVKRIDNFMRVNRQQLKSRKLRQRSGHLAGPARQD